MSEKKKQEYTTGGLKNRQDVENALASAEYRPSQEVTDAASDLKQWQANRPGAGRCPDRRLWFQLRGQCGPAGIPAADRCTERGHPHAVPAGAGYLPERRRCLGGADRPAERAGAECPAEV